jgi:hypothetical protein
LVTTVTCRPASRRCSAQVRPAMPEPTTTRRWSPPSRRGCGEPSGQAGQAHGLQSWSCAGAPRTGVRSCRPLPLIEPLCLWVGVGTEVAPHGLVPHTTTGPRPSATTSIRSRPRCSGRRRSIPTVLAPTARHLLPFGVPCFLPGTSWRSRCRGRSSRSCATWRRRCNDVVEAAVLERL